MNAKPSSDWVLAGLWSHGPAMPALVGHSRAWTECLAKPGQLIGLGRAFGSSIQIMWRRRTDDKLQFVLRDFAAIDASQVFQGPVVQLILYSFNQFPNETKKTRVQPPCFSSLTSISRLLIALMLSGSHMQSLQMQASARVAFLSQNPLNKQRSET